MVIQFFMGLILDPGNVVNSPGRSCIYSIKLLSCYTQTIILLHARCVHNNDCANRSRFFFTDVNNNNRFRNLNAPPDVII